MDLLFDRRAATGATLVVITHDRALAARCDRIVELADGRIVVGPPAMSDWPLAWRLARRELDLRFRGLRLLLACLFLGVGALAAIGSLTQAIERELARARQQRSWAATSSSPCRSAPRRPRNSPRWRGSGRCPRPSGCRRPRSRGDRQRAGRTERRSTRAYPLYGALTLADGRRVERRAAGDVWIAPALADRLGARAGRRFRFGTARLHDRGHHRDEPDRLGEGFTLGPVAIVSTAAIARTGLVQPGSLYESKYRVELPVGADPTPPRPVQGRHSRPPGGKQDPRPRRARRGAVHRPDGAVPDAGRAVGAGHRRDRRRQRRVILSRRPPRQHRRAEGAGRDVGPDRAGLSARRSAWSRGRHRRRAGRRGRRGARDRVGWRATCCRSRRGSTIEIAPLVLAAAYGLLIALAFTAAPLVDGGQRPGRRAAARVVRRRRAPRSANAGHGRVPRALAIVALAIGDRGSAGADRRLPGGGCGRVAGPGRVRLADPARGRRACPASRRPLLRLAVAALHRPGARTGTLVVALGLGLTLFVLLAAIRTSIDANIARTVPAPRARAVRARRAARSRGRVPADDHGDRARRRRSAPCRRCAARSPATATTRVADLKTMPDGAWALRGERGLTYSATLPEGSTITAGRWWPRDYAGPPLVSIDERLADGARPEDRRSAAATACSASSARARIASFRRIDWDTLGFNYVMVFSPNAIWRRAA